MATIESTAKLLLNGQPVAGKKLKPKDLKNLVPDVTRVVKDKSRAKIVSTAEEIAKYYGELTKRAAMAPMVGLALESLFDSVSKKTSSRTRVLREVGFFTKLDLFELNLPPPEMIKYPGPRTNIEFIGQFGKSGIQVKSEADYNTFTLRLGQIKINNLNELMDERQQDLVWIAIEKTAEKVKNYVSAIFRIKGNYRGRGFYVFKRLFYYTGLDLHAFTNLMLDLEDKYVKTSVKYHTPKEEVEKSIYDNTVLSQEVTIYVNFNIKLFSSHIMQEELLKLYKEKIDILQRYNYHQANFAAGELVPEVMKANKMYGEWNVFEETKNR